MFSLYKKEVQSYFYSPFAYVVSALFLLVFSLSFINGISTMDSSVLKFSFSNIFYTGFFYFIFLIPLLTMRTFAEERKSHTETLWLSAPITIAQVVFAKFFAVATVFLLMMALSLFFPLVAWWHGSVILTSLICGYLGFFLWSLVCIAIGILISALTDNPIIAAVLGEAAMILVLFLDNLTNTALIQSIPAAAKIFGWFSTETRFGAFSQGLFSLADLVFFLSITLVVLVWTVIIIEKRRWSRSDRRGVKRIIQFLQTDNSISAKNKRFTALAWVLAILVLAIAIPFNLIFERLNVNFDMTPNNLYTLSQTTTDYLEELDAQGIVVDVYFLTEMEELESDLEWLALYRTLLLYNEYACFNLIDFDPDTEPEILRKVNPDGVFNLNEADFLFVYGDMVKRLPGTMMYTYQTDENDNVVGAEFRAENYFTGYMKTVVEGVMPTVYFLEGHGEIPLSGMTMLAANLGNYNYGAQTLNLTTATAVPEDCCILVAAGPQYDLTDDEYNKIYAYTEDGGNIELLMTPNSARTTYPNFERLMSSYCIGMNYDRVTETDPNRHSYDDPYAMMCDIAEASLEAKDDLTAALLPTVNNLVTYMPYSRSFYALYGTNYGAMSMDTLIRTASTAQSEPWGGLQLDPQTVTGRALPLAMYAADSQREDSKLVVFGSADIISDAGVSNAYFINPLQLFLTTITWMYDSDVDMNIAHKERTYDSLDVNSSAQASGLIALFVGFPAAVALAGVIVWLRRKDA